MYIDFNWTCFKKYDTERFYTQYEDLDYTQISVDKKSCKGLQRKGKHIFTKFGITVLMLYTYFLQLRDMSIFFDLWIIFLLFMG